MSGTGNTFIFANLMSEKHKHDFSALYKNISLNEIAKKLCQHPLISTDGAVFLVPSTSADFKWLFFNNNGSEAEMCGNAARCATIYAHDQKIIKKACSFETLAGVIYGEVVNPMLAKIKMTPLRDIQLNQSIKNSQLYTRYDYIDSGVPHCVIKVSDISNFDDLRPLALKLRSPEYFSPRGANITFKVPHSKSAIKSVSFERGVEDFTEACGTGAIAAAYSHAVENNYYGKTIVSVPGGELTVEFKDSYPYLTGSVKYIGHINYDELKRENSHER